mmetsp:Transcript_10551/g.26299  ORF Transcript_10551/g.26299 Transcript_10551/m.26299 type:complete len:342 (-) Transcript_10551:9-1034(-)
MMRKGIARPEAERGTLRAVAGVPSDARRRPDANTLCCPHCAAPAGPSSHHADPRWRSRSVALPAALGRLLFTTAVDIDGALSELPVPVGPRHAAHDRNIVVVVVHQQARAHRRGVTEADRVHRAHARFEQARREALHHHLTRGYGNAVPLPTLVDKPLRASVDGSPCPDEPPPSANSAKVHCCLGARGFCRRRGEANAQLSVARRLEQRCRRRRGYLRPENIHSATRRRGCTEAHGIHGSNLRFPPARGESLHHHAAQPHRHATARSFPYNKPMGGSIDGSPRYPTSNRAEVHCHLRACGLRRRRGEAHAQLASARSFEEWRRGRDRRRHRLRRPACTERA